MKGKQFLYELKRRRVFSVAAGYLVVSWALIQVADVLLPTVVNVLLVVLVLLFPLAMVLAWVFDITPEGIKQTLAAWHEEPGPSDSDAVAVGVDSIASAGSILVLPFLNIGGEESNEYFSDGLTEDLIDTLSKVPGLQVVARTSAFVFKNKHEDIRKIGTQLNVRYVVEGSIRKAPDRLRIVVQLIKVKDGFHIWSQTFDRKLFDVFDTLDDITQAIVRHMVEFLGDEGITDKSTQPQWLTRRTNNLEAYKYYLKGRYHWNQRGEGIAKGMENFKQAVKEDPDYAMPYVGLADSFALMGYYGFMPPRQAFPTAYENATKALTLDQSLGEAYASRAVVKMYFDWDWQAAEQEFHKAIELNARYAPAHYWLAVLYTVTQRLPLALEEDKLAFEVDPASPYVLMHHGWTLHCAGRNDEAIKQFLRAQELDATLLPAYQLLTYAYAEAGEYEKALQTGGLMLKASGNSVLPMPAVGYTHAKAGDKEKALGVIAELESRQGEFFWPSHVASIYAELGDFDKTGEWLEKAFEVRDHWLITMNVQPAFRAVHKHPQYASFASRAGIGELGKAE